MRLWDRLLSRYGNTFWEGEASGAAILTTTYGQPDREAILPQVTAWAQQANASDSPVFAAIMARMRLFSEAQFQFQRANDRGLFGNTSLAVLERPWPKGTTGELLARMEQDVSLAGNFYVWDATDQLVRLRPDWVTIISELVTAPRGGHYRRLRGYWFEPPEGERKAYGDPQMFTADEVAHWAPIPDPAASFRGMSWLTPVMRDIIADSGMVGYKVKYLENSASPNMLIRYAAKLQPATIDAVRERMHARYGGVGNAFKTLVLDQGADVTMIGANLEQMDFANVAQAGAERILAAAGVPPLVVGLEPIKGAGRSYEQVMRHFADLWARPQWRSACGALEQVIPGGVPSGIRLWVDTGEIAALQDGEQVRAQVSLVRAQAILTLVQAGMTRDSAVIAVEAGDVSLLQPDPAAALGPAAPTTVQHLLPQAQPGATADPLPPALPRLGVGSTSPGDGGNNTRPTPRPSAARRALELEAAAVVPDDGEDWQDGDDLDLDELLADAETPPRDTAEAARFDPYHKPVGPGGGQFTTGGGTGGGGAKANGSPKAGGGKATATAHRPSEDATEAHLKAQAAAARAEAKRLQTQLDGLLAQMRTSVAAHHRARTAAQHPHQHHAIVTHRKTATHHHRHARALHSQIAALRSRISGLLAQARALDARVAAM